MVSRGERLGTRLFVAALVKAGVKAEYVDAMEVVVTRGPFGGAAPNLEATDVAARKRLRPLLAAGVTPVVPGFLGLYRPRADDPAGSGDARARGHRSDGDPDGPGAGRIAGDAVEGRSRAAHRRSPGGSRRPGDSADEHPRGG